MSGTYDTPEKLAHRRKQLEDKDIEALFKRYDTLYKKGELVEANKVACRLSKKYGIEGDRSFAVGSRDF